MQIKLYDEVLLKDGRTGTVIDINDNGSVDIDIGNSPADWETLWFIPVSDIEKVIEKH